MCVPPSLSLFTNNAGSSCKGYTASTVKMTVYYKQKNVEAILTYSNALVCYQGLRKTLLMTHDFSARNITQYHLHVKSANNISINFSCFQVNEAVKAGQKISLLST
jgi:serine acetyltransferase